MQAFFSGREGYLGGLQEQLPTHTATADRHERKARNTANIAKAKWRSSEASQHGPAGVHVVGDKLSVEDSVEKPT